MQVVSECKSCGKNKEDTKSMKFPTGFFTICATCEQEILWTRKVLQIGMAKRRGTLKDFAVNH